MKKITTLFILLFSAATFAQSVSVDMTNKYVWRGADLGGFSIQPMISTEVGPVEVGVWSSYALNDNSLSELDLYVSGSIGSFDLAVTNYYFPGATTDGALDFAGGSLTDAARAEQLMTEAGEVTNREVKDIARMIYGTGLRA